MVINLSGAVNLAILQGQWAELNFTVMVYLPEKRNI
jgi:hypothetical protein